MAIVSVSAQSAEVKILGCRTKDGHGGYYLMIDWMMTGWKSYPNPPSSQGLATYFAISERHIKDLLTTHFKEVGLVEKILAEIKKQIGLL